eukprot:9222473-Prorocentrum_lima.AAC.1
MPVESNFDKTTRRITSFLLLMLIAHMLEDPGNKSRTTRKLWRTLATRQGREIVMADLDSR